MAPTIPGVKRFACGRATLYLADCRTMVAQLPVPEVLITDPPVQNKRRLRGHALPDDIFDPMPWAKLAPLAAIWGVIPALWSRLPAFGSFLVWDRMPGMAPEPGAACGVVAWISLVRPLRIYRQHFEPRPAHPSEKPATLMAWTLAQLRPAKRALILDPFMGTGSTGIAAVRAGHPFIGIEIERSTFEIACERIEDAQRQMDLIVDVLER
jgi:site-specific DNA-methyltransferase (adenine-specific)